MKHIKVYNDLEFDHFLFCGMPSINLNIIYYDFLLKLLVKITCVQKYKK